MTKRRDSRHTSEHDRRHEKDLGEEEEKEKKRAVMKQME